MPTTVGHTIAPPMPMTIRHPITTSMLGASPPSTENTPKIAAPIMKIRRRPYRSASFSPVTIRTPRTRAYPLITRCAVVRSVPMSFSIWGIATLSAVTSFAVNDTRSAMATSASFVLRSSRPVIVVAMRPSLGSQLPG